MRLIMLFLMFLFTSISAWEYEGILFPSKQVVLSTLSNGAVVRYHAGKVRLFPAAKCFLPGCAQRLAQSCTGKRKMERSE